jgi:hypothetical protein
MITLKHVGASALASIFLLAFTAESADAQRGRGGGPGAARMGVGGARVGMAGPGLRGAAIRGPGVGFQGPGVYRGVGPGIRTAGIRSGYVGAVGSRWAGVRPGIWRGNRWHGNRWRGWGWGFPVAAAAVGLGYYAGNSYYNDCIAWDGYQWVNVCYSGGYGYGGYGYW